MVNINDMQITMEDVKRELNGRSINSLIFERQRELITKYSVIEENALRRAIACSCESKETIYDTTDTNIQTTRGQIALKDHFWRVVEELGESEQAYRNNEEEHYREELIDALHFFVEGIIIAGGNENSVKDIFLVEPLEQKLDKTNHKELYHETTYYLGITANTLKNKLWKTTHVPTDQNLFWNLINQSWDNFIKLLKSCMTDEEIVHYYLRKNKVNFFRQNSGY